MNGITLLAIGKPQYGGAAYNLALSCKKYCPEIPIQLVFEKSAISHLSDMMKAMAFDYLTEINHTHAYEGKLMPAKAKTHLYDYFLFDKTLFIDADTVALKSFEDLFEGDFDVKMEVKSAQSVAIDKHKDFHWMYPKHLRECYELTDEPLYGLSSAFMLVKKGKMAEMLFTQAKLAYENRPNITHLKEQWGRSYPDELFFAVAYAKTGIDPQMKPVIYTAPKKVENLENYYFFSLLGTKVHRTVEETYDREVYKSCLHFGVKNYFPVKNLIKHKWLNN